MLCQCWVVDKSPPRTLFYKKKKIKGQLLWFKSEDPGASPLASI